MHTRICPIGSSVCSFSHPSIQPSILATYLLSKHVLSLALFTLHVSVEISDLTVTFSLK